MRCEDLVNDTLSFLFIVNYLFENQLHGLKTNQGEVGSKFSIEGDYKGYDEFESFLKS